MKNNQDEMYRQIQDAINSLPENFSILEEQIDLELQLQYFNFSKELKNEFTKQYILDKKNDLFDDNVPVEEKKTLLVLLASIGEVEAYRAIEAYIHLPEPELKEWAKLAIQESRMILQSSLLDEQQVFISTGLGGHGKKLRYFFVLRGKKYPIQFTPVQQQLIQSELTFGMQKHEGELESIEFEDGLAMGLFLMPLKTDMEQIFRTAIEECNQFGNFLNDDVILTNVRKLSSGEVKAFLENEDMDQNENNDEEFN